MAFIDDIQSRDTALYPVVIFETSSTAPGDIQISTKPVSIGHRTFTPLLLSSPSIKESIDLENRKYKISNVSLKVSNVEYNGERFSDKISLHEKGGAINTQAAIYWISPSVESENIGFDLDSGNAAYFAYKGVVRAITHDEKTCNITLEDISQSTLHTDVPVTLLGTNDEIPEKYRMKPVPMVYGTVDRSPVVINHTESGTEWYEDGVLSYTVSIDRLPITEVVHNDVPNARVLDENPEGFLYVDTGASPLRIPYSSKFYTGESSHQIVDDDVSLGDTETGEYANVIIKSYYSSGDITALNPAGDNYIEAEAVRLPISASAYLIGLSQSLPDDSDDTSSLDNINIPFTDAFDGNSNTALEIDRHVVDSTNSPNDYRGMAITFKIDSIGDENVDETDTWLLASVRMSCYDGTECRYYVDNFTAADRIHILTGNGGNGLSIDNYFATPIPEVGYTAWDIDNGTVELITSHDQELEFYAKKITNWFSPNEGDSIRLYDIGFISSDFEGLDMSQDIHGVALYQRMLIKDPISRNFFANVVGRT